LLGLLLLGAAGVGALNWFSFNFGGRSALRIGAAAGSATAAFMISLFLGWLAASLASLLSRRHRAVTVAAFAITSAAGILMACSGQLRLAEARRWDAQTSTSEVRSFLKDVRTVIRENLASDRASSAKSSSTTQPAAAAASLSLLPAPRALAATAAPSTQSSEAKRMADVGRDVVADLLEARKRYETAVHSAKLDEILRPDRLADKNCYGPARQQLADVRRAIDSFEADSNRIWAGVEQRLIAARVSASARRGFMSGLNASRAQSSKAFAQVLALERQTLRQSETILNFLEPRLTRVRLSSDGQLIFMSKSDADTHNRNVTQLLATIEQEQRVQAQNRDTALKKLDELADTVEHP
jgi:hypothetical protein